MTLKAILRLTELFNLVSINVQLFLVFFSSHTSLTMFSSANMVYY